MIIKNEYWVDIVSKGSVSNAKRDSYESYELSHSTLIAPPSTRVYSGIDLIKGKWLYFGDTERIHSLLDTLDALVERGDIKAIKISRKLEGFDPFPNKPCVLCAYTTNIEAEKKIIKNILKELLGSEPHIWKSEKQTMLDWQENGWLRLESEANKLILSLSKENNNDNQLKRSIIWVLRKLEHYSGVNKNRDSLSEMKINNVDRYISDILMEIEKGGDIGKKLKEINNMDSRFEKAISSLTRIEPVGLNSSISKRALVLVKDNQISNAIDLLYNQFESTNDKRIFELVLLSSQLCEYERNISLGLEFEDKVKNRIKWGILSLLQ